MACDITISMLNEIMGGIGQLQDNCDLLFFTPGLCFKAKFCGQLKILVYERINPDGWTLVGSGTVDQMAATLNASGPFLTDISTYWANIPT